jgi:hypothetical protein
MKIGRIKPVARATVIIACSLALSACFDLTQKLSIGRTGGGSYEIAITAQGLLGEALKDKRESALDLKENRVKTRVVSTDGKTTQIAVMKFNSLSDLRLSDESLSLRNHGRSWFGLGPSHVTFRRTFLVDRARRENTRGHGDEGDRFRTELGQTMFGDHAYVFSVTLPGSIDRAAPVKIGRAMIKPQITGDMLHGHTVTWRMPLYTMLQAKLLTFEVDFSAYGSFPDAQSLPAGVSGS